MSATYLVRGQRYLRKYSAAKSTPSYAAAAEAATIASTLCELQWAKAENVNPCFTTHPGSSDASAVDSSNLSSREYFDAALFCANHDSSTGTHKGYANAACYRLTLPDLADGESARVLESLSVAVNCDPYVAAGARIAVFTNSTGVIPTACTECRNGSSSDTDSAKQHHDSGSSVWSSTNTHVEGAAPRTTSNGTWYAGSGTATIAPTGGLTVGKYIFVFVLLENYNTSRKGYLEGSAFIQRNISITLASAISSWDAMGDVPFIDTVVGSDDTFEILKGSGFPSVHPNGRFYMLSAVPKCGVEYPDRTLYTTKNSLMDPGIICRVDDGTATTQVSETGTGVWAPVMTSPTILLSLGSGVSDRHRGTFVAEYAFDDSTGYSLSFRIGHSTVSTATTSAYTWELATVSVDESAIPSDVLSLLEGNLVTGFVTLFASSRFHLVQTDGTTHLLVPVLVTSASGTYVLGFLQHEYGSSASDKTVNGGWSLLCMSSGYKISNYEVIAAAYAGATNSEVASACTIDVSNHSITFSGTNNAWLLQHMYFAWVQQSSETSTIICASNGKSIGCTGNVTSVMGLAQCPLNTDRGIAWGLPILVSGELTQVGTTNCSRFAVVDMVPNQYDEDPDNPAVATYAAADAALSLIPVTAGFSVSLLGQGSGTGYPDGFAVVSCSGGFQVGGVIKYAAYVDIDGTLTNVQSAFNHPISQMISDRGKTFYVMFDVESVLRYSATPVDSLLSVVSPGSAAIGLRNGYAKAISGDVLKFQASQSVIPKANFVVTSVTDVIQVSSDLGHTVEPLSIPGWRISYCPVLVPFSTPAWSSSAAKVHLSWTAISGAHADAMLNVWVKKGSRVTQYTDDLKQFSLYAADKSSVGDWELLGSCKASGTTSADFPIALDGYSEATLLLTAWMPDDAINPDSDTPSTFGVGTLSVSKDGTFNTEADGWLPEISLTM